MTETASVWSERIAAWRASGLRQREYCAQHGYSYTSLVMWITRLNKARQVVKALPVSTPSRPFPIAVRQSGSIVIEQGSIRVVIHSDSDRAMLREVLTMLGVA